MSKLGKLFSRVRGAGYSVRRTVSHNSPKILMGLGTVGVGTAFIWGCVQTRKLDGVLDKHEARLEQLRRIRQKSAEAGENEKYGKETAMVYGSTMLNIARLYAGPFAILCASLGCFYSSHKIMVKRNFALAAGYKALDTSFKEYRQRTAEKFGSEVEKEILTNTKLQSTDETVVNENGEEVTMKTVDKVADPDAGSPYGRYFTRHNEHWDRSPDVIKIFMLNTQRDLNDLLFARAKTSPRGIGMVTLNEAFERMGFDIPADGSGLSVGWIYDEHEPFGDNYIELDVSPCRLPGDDGRLQQAYYVDFNVDGNIERELYERDLRKRALARR